MQNTKQITCTLAEALEKGVKVGDKATFEFELTEIKWLGCSMYKFENEYLGAYFYLPKTNDITFAPSVEPYTPKDREFCAVLTKTGLTTECEAYHCKGEIYAIPMKDGKPDGIFNPSQIEKFYKL